MKTTNKDHDEIFRIGAVSRLTGLSTHTLRKWESRYGAVEPGRTASGGRYYTRDDLQRLSLMKHLVDSGVAPSDVAQLSHVELTRRSEQLAAMESAAGAQVQRPLRTVIFGNAVAALFQRQGAVDSALEIVCTGATPEFASDNIEGPIDVLIVEYPTVNSDTHRQVETLRSQLQAAVVVVVYGFAARNDLLDLRTPAIATLRAPVDYRTLEQIAVQLVEFGEQPRSDRRASRPIVDTSGDVPAPRLSREVIARLASTTPRVRCECPHHLADIVLSLRAFEEYSEACESSNPEDAALHRYLWHSAAHARALFEEAIERVAEAEGITLEE